jgi:hypothetical protein
VEHEQLASRLSNGEIVVLPEAEWRALESHYEVVVSHNTQVAGLLQVLRGPAGLVAVEAPQPKERTIRVFSHEGAAETFVADRLSKYDRMWEG